MKRKNWQRKTKMLEKSAERSKSRVEKKGCRIVERGPGAEKDGTEHGRGRSGVEWKQKNEK